MTKIDHAQDLSFHRIGCKPAMQKHNNIQVLRSTMVQLEMMRTHTEREEHRQALTNSIALVQKEIDNLVLGTHTGVRPQG